jgi:tRNA(Ile)-lysidine synthase
MSLLTRFIDNWEEKFAYLIPANMHCILAVSGGIDSIVLVDIMFQIGLDCTIAHCNFQLRGEESLRDELFVRSLEDKYNLPVKVMRFDTDSIATEQKKGIQETARMLRYNWFKQLLQEKQGDKNNYLLTAHHADDTIETVLFNFFRGTGISGLTGITEYDKNNSIIRPLLFAKRSDIVEYATAPRHLSWVEDSSNASDKYSRNYIRHQLIPSIQKIFPDIQDTILHNIDRFKNTELLYQQSIDQHKKKLLTTKGEEIHIPVLKLKQANPLHAIVWEIIKPFSFSSAQVPEVVKLLDAENGSYVSSGTSRIIKNRNWIIITSLQQGNAKHILIEKSDTEILFEEGKLQLEYLQSDNVKMNTSVNVALIDSTEIKFPLLLRKWKQGDYFYPLGMPKKKKLSRFFIDAKLSLTDKEKVWVIESNKKIIWVIGMRIDDRLKLTAATKNILRITWLAKG